MPSGKSFKYILPLFIGVLLLANSANSQSFGKRKYRPKFSSSKQTWNISLAGEKSSTENIDEEKTKNWKISNTKKRIDEATGHRAELFCTLSFTLLCLASFSPYVGVVLGNLSVGLIIGSILVLIGLILAFIGKRRVNHNLEKYSKLNKKFADIVIAVGGFVAVCILLLI